MLALVAKLGRTRRDERGANLIEYTLLLALIAIVCIAAVTFLGNTMQNTYYSNFGSAIPG